MRTHFSVWKTTVLGGVIFLLPFAIIVFLIGEIAQFIYSVAAHFERAVPDWSVGGISLAVVLATLILLLLCYVAGLAARWSFGRRFSEKLERNLLLLFPRYAIWKSHLATNVGAEHGGDIFQFQPVLVTFDEVARVGFEIERSGALPEKTSAAQVKPAADVTVTVYLPGSPDPWNGHVVHVAADRVKPLSVNFSEAAALCESMGRGSGAVLPAGLQSK
jgi:uncharacterized membrane protein